VAREQRKLAAILAADVVGYSRLMGRDESGTLARLRKNRSEHLDPILAKYGGRLVKLTGDGALIEFASAVDALSAAIEFQQAMAEANGDRPADAALVFRMGLHLGDLIVDGDDLYGDGVNIAARLEAEAPAGGILISRNVRDAVAGRVKATFEDLGGLSLKNIERPVRAFQAHWDASAWCPQAATEGTVPTKVISQSSPTMLPLPDKPSIAVLPLQNMSDDREQEYFADGITEDITTALSRIPSLFVIARNSAFAYKGKAIDIRQIGRELGVRYVLEGSVRKAGERLRITGQLVEAETGTHLWVDRFDSVLQDAFDLQDRVAMAVAGAIEPSVMQAEIRRAYAKPTHNLRAYDWLLRALGEQQLRSREGIDRAIEMVRYAIELDPRYAQAYAHLAHFIMPGEFLVGWMMKLERPRKASASDAWRCSWRRTTRSC
jgi:adenylate cyclase